MRSVLLPLVCSGLTYILYIGLGPQGGANFHSGGLPPIPPPRLMGGLLTLRRLLEPDCPVTMTLVESSYSTILAGALEGSNRQTDFPGGGAPTPLWAKAYLYKTKTTREQ